MSSAHPMLEFIDDPARFLEVAEEYLASDPVLSTVIATVTRRLALPEATPLPYAPWWLVVRDADGVVVGAGMRTAPFAPYPLYLLPMPDAAAVALAAALAERGEPMPAVNGALPASMVLAEESARLAGGTARVAMHTRLFDLPELVPPMPAEGRFRLARHEDERDIDLVSGWFHDFFTAADEQAGRAPGERVHVEFARDEVVGRIVAGLVGLWEVDGVVVQLTAWSLPAFGVSRIGPVFTPREHRGHGYASATVAEVSRRIIAAGDRACLFTDQANPTSNRIYQALGYRALVDLADIVVD